MNFHSLEQTTWDAVVVGSGFGGGAVSHALTRKGYRVLLVEKGRADAVNAALLSASDDPDDKLREGRWPTKIPISFNGQLRETWPVIGCGLGGSSIHYGATLSRLRRDDLEELLLPDGNAVGWPFGYDDLEPYYREAEALLNVCGTCDPLETRTSYDLHEPPVMSEADRRLFQSMRQAGLNPFRLHVGLQRPADCDRCVSGACTMECKTDVRNTFIDPGRKSGNLTIVTESEALRVKHDGERVDRVVVRCGSDVREIRARMVVLAAGALFSPILLVNSASDRFPKGLGNDHDLVGRNLMFHAGDYLAIWQKGGSSRAGMNKSIAFRDFYRCEGRRFGEVQSMGFTAGYGEILFYLQSMLARSLLGRLPGVSHAARIPAYVASKVLKEATVMSALVEDLPYLDNRVVVDDTSPSGTRIEYQIHDELADRVKRYRRLIKDRLASLRIAVMNPGVELNWGHPCGTCRAGTDPQMSVLDGNCRVHGVENLYVADASFMPTSGGTNPSLTIAANGLRVADAIARRLAAGNETE